MIKVAKQEDFRKWNPICDTKVWADLERASVVAKVNPDNYSTNRQKIPCNKVTSVKIECNGRSDNQALSRVQVRKAKVHGQ
jgi:hypothetical protein